LISTFGGGSGAVKPNVKNPSLKRHSPAMDKRSNAIAHQSLSERGCDGKSQ
jgi:hypothetical protein